MWLTPYPNPQMSVQIPVLDLGKPPAVPADHQVKTCRLVARGRSRQWTGRIVDLPDLPIPRLNANVERAAIDGTTQAPQQPWLCDHATQHRRGVRGRHDRLGHQAGRFPPVH